MARIFRKLAQLLDVDVTSTPPNDGERLTWDDGTSKWIPAPGAGGSGAPDDATYLVATANGDLSAEVVVGATPGGELGGTWASPTVDATHSGSSHASVQAAAEATAAAALSSHEADTTSVHGITNTAVLETTTGAQTKVDTHVNDTSAAHAASAISVSSTTLSGTGTDVQAVFEEVDNLLDDHSSRHENGGADEISIANLDGTSTELAAHLADTTDAHDASAISVLDTNGDYTATNVEGVLAEIAPLLGGGGLFDAIAVLKDVKAAGTNGGSSTLGSFQTRVLNTEEDPQSIVTLSSNQFTLDAGTYFLISKSPVYNVAAHKAKLRNITDSADTIIGTSEQVQPSGSSAWVFGTFTIAGTKTFEIQHRTEGSQATNGFGVQSGFSVSEVYTVVVIFRFA